MSHKPSDNWQKLNKRDLNYHIKQWQTQKRSTISFEKFCSSHLKKSNSIIDRGGGTGAAISYFAKKYRKTNFVSMDISEKLTEIGVEIAKQKKMKNLTFEKSDFYTLSKRADCDGAISMQTLSCLPGYNNFLKSVFTNIKPSWLGHNKFVL